MHGDEHLRPRRVRARHARKHILARAVGIEDAVHEVARPRNADRRVDPAEIGLEMKQPMVRQQRVDDVRSAPPLGQLPHPLQVGGALRV